MATTYQRIKKKMMKAKEGKTVEKAVVSGQAKPIRVYVKVRGEGRYVLNPKLEGKLWMLAHDPSEKLTNAPRKAERLTNAPRKAERLTVAPRKTERLTVG